MKRNSVISFFRYWKNPDSILLLLERLSKMARITLRGRNDGLEVEFNQSKHVELTGGFYEKTDNENVAVVNGRYYRRNSKLIAELCPRIYGANRFCLAGESVVDFFTKEIIHVSESYAVQKNDRFFFEKETGEIKPIPAGSFTYYNSSWIEFRECDKNHGYTNKYVFSPSIQEAILKDVIVIVSGVAYLKKDTYKMHPSYNRERIAVVPGKRMKNNNFAMSLDDLIKSETLIDISGGLHNFNDIQFSVTPTGERYKPIVNTRTGLQIDPRPNPYSVSMNTLSSGVKDAIRTAVNTDSRSGVNAVLKSKWFAEKRVDSDFETKSYLTLFGIPVGEKSDCELIDNLYLLCQRIYPEKIATDFIESNNWFGKHSNEPIPCLFTNNNVGDQGGDYVYVLGKRTNITDKNLTATGGVGYTFGVEIETEKGVVPMEVGKMLDVNIVGDRSIGGLEYVTGVLSGDAGMVKLMEVAETVGKYCMSADTCGIHVHVGGDGGKWTPTFDKEFAVLSVMVGCAIEEEMFSLLPSNRMSRKNSNGQSYCGSILDYSDITLKNWKEKLFHYVYARNPEDNSEGFTELSSLVEKRHQVGRWGAGRYKWLNLVNCVTDNSGRRNGGGFRTIEFRQYNGTLNKNDIRAFVLMSLAFVAFVEQNRKQIPTMSSISIRQIVGETMTVGVQAWFNDWYNRRTAQVDAVNGSKVKTKTI